MRGKLVNFEDMRAKRKGRVSIAEIASERKAARWLGRLDDVPVFDEKVFLARKPRKEIPENIGHIQAWLRHPAGLVGMTERNELGRGAPSSPR